MENSFAMLTALSPYIGYEAASDIAREAAETGKTVREVALEKRLFTREQIDVILSTVEMTKPGIAGLKAMRSAAPEGNFITKARNEKSTKGEGKSDT